MIYQGALEIAYCVDLKLAKTKNWWLDLVYGVAMIALAIALISLEISQGVGSIPAFELKQVPVTDKIIAEVYI